jgi:hypothetical protein
MHSQRNRDIAAEALAGDNSPRVAATPNGALTDLAGVALFALVVMGLLAFGYARKSSFETAQVPPPVAGGSMAQPVGTADRPKVYHPVNPAPDTRNTQLLRPLGSVLTMAGGLRNSPRARGSTLDRSLFLRAPEHK